MAGPVKVSYAQWIGARSEQQDACGGSNEDDIDFIQHGGVLAVVADGIGGHAHGGGASDVAVREFVRAYRTKLRRTAIPVALYSALKKANAAVCEFAEAQGEKDNCGTTLVAAVMHSKSRAFYWISIGDSRLYLLRGDEWVQITTDANYGHRRVKQIARGTLSEEESEPGGNLGTITSFLGATYPRDIDRSFRPFRVHPGDRLVLCTDGLFNALSQEEIVECLRQNEPQGACEALIRQVSAKGYKNQDNCTVAVLGYKLGGPQAQEPEDPSADLDAPPKTRWWGLSRWSWIALILLAALLLGGWAKP